MFEYVRADDTVKSTETFWIEMIQIGHLDAVELGTRPRGFPLAERDSSYETISVVPERLAQIAATTADIQYPPRGRGHSPLDCSIHRLINQGAHVRVKTVGRVGVDANPREPLWLVCFALFIMIHKLSCSRHYPAPAAKHNSDALAHATREEMMVSSRDYSPMSVEPLNANPSWLLLASDRVIQNDTEPSMARQWMAPERAARHFIQYVSVKAGAGVDYASIRRSTRSSDTR